MSTGRSTLPLLWARVKESQMNTSGHRGLGHVSRAWQPRASFTYYSVCLFIFSIVFGSKLTIAESLVPALDLNFPAKKMFSIAVVLLMAGPVAATLPNWTPEWSMPLSTVFMP